MHVEPTRDNPNDEPTRMADFSAANDSADIPTGYAEVAKVTAYSSPTYGEPADYYAATPPPAVDQPEWLPPTEPPSPWYLRAPALVGWGVLTALLITLLVWGMVREMTKDASHTTPATTSVSATTTAPYAAPSSESPSPDASDRSAEPQPAPPPPSTNSPAPSSTHAPSSTAAPTTTTAPHTTTPATTTPETTTATTTTATTAGPLQLPSEIVIPLPPGL